MRVIVELWEGRGVGDGVVLVSAELCVSVLGCGDRDLLSCEGNEREWREERREEGWWSGRRVECAGGDYWVGWPKDKRDMFDVDYEMRFTQWYALNEVS